MRLKESGSQLSSHPFRVYFLPSYSGLFALLVGCLEWYKVVKISKLWVLCAGLYASTQYFQSPRDTLKELQ